jgi:hypothetical protein
MRNAAGRRVLLLAGGSAAVGLVAAYLPISGSLENLYDIGIVDGEVASLFALLIGLLAFLIAVVSAILVAIHGAIKRKLSAVGVAVVGYSLLTMVFLCVGTGLRPRLDHLAEVRLAEQGRPIVVAITAFIAEHGRSPNQLEELKPRYMAEIPETGLALYPKFEIVTSTGDKRNCFGDDWLLRADALPTKILMRGFGGCDSYIFAPSGRYPSSEIDTICHYGDGVGGWDYEYGD